MTVRSDKMRYASIQQRWAEFHPRRALTRAEAERLARAIYARFGRATAEYPSQLHDARMGEGEPRRCWVASRPGCSQSRGIPRVVHDVSHSIWDVRFPRRGGHDFGHAKFEQEVQQWVIARGWMEPPRKPTALDRRYDRAFRRLASIQLRLDAWESKRRRADNALARLRRQLPSAQAALHRLQQEVLDAQVRAVRDLKVEP